jgi:hypothetical protein
MVTLGLFIEQVLSADQSCQDAVARALSARVAQRQAPSSLNTGPYCKARARLPLGLLERMGRELGRELCAGQPVTWRWRTREVKLVDGTVVSMPDTSANQASFPQNHEQKAGLGFPLARVVAITSLSCVSVLEWAVGPCEGKETGETALLWGLAHKLVRGDVVVIDRCYAGYFMLAWLMRWGVDVVVRQHHTHEGEVFAVQNDSVLAAFRGGAVEAFAQQSVRAAQAVQRGFGALDETWQSGYGLKAAVAIGLHLGDTVFGVAGSKDDRRFVVLGDTVSIAERLMHRARAGEFVFSEKLIEVLVRTGFEIEAEELPALELARRPAIPIYGVLLDTRLDFT